MWRAELQQLNGRLGDLVAAGEEGVHGEVGEPVEVLQAGVDPNLGGEVRMRELVHCPPTTIVTLWRKGTMAGVRCRWRAV